MENINLVIGGSGFLGNNVVRELLSQKKMVRVSVRDTNNKEPFENLDCEIVYADILDKNSLIKAMEGVDKVYNCAAVYKIWAKDPQKEIIDVNTKGAKNVVEAAIEAKIGRLVFVSSALVQSMDNPPINENANWNDSSTEPYTISKVEAEKIAQKIAKENGLDMISILPAAMIGPNSFGHIPPSMELYYKIMKNQLPFDPQFRLNIVDVRDVVKWMIIAAEKASSGSRYIFGPENSITSTEVYQQANLLFPHVEIRPKRSRAFLMAIATIMEVISKINKKQPLLQKNFVKLLTASNYYFDSSKAINELGFHPRPNEEALEDLFKYIESSTKAESFSEVIHA